MEIKYLENKTLNSDPLISIVIINYNGLKYLPELFMSLSEQTYKNFELVIWDNNSSDGSQQWLREQKIIKKCIPIYNDSNLGFGRANNESIKFTNGELICLLNNDTIVDKHWLRELYYCIKLLKADIAGPKILFSRRFIEIKLQIDKEFYSYELPYCLETEKHKTLINNSNPNNRLNRQGKFKLMNDDRIQIPILKFSKKKNAFIFWNLSEKRNITFNYKKKIDSGLWEVSLSKNQPLPIINSTGLMENTHNGKTKDIGIFEYDNGQFNEPKYVWGLSGCSFILTKTLMSDISFDPDYFMYYEDVDFFKRLHKASKYKIMYCPKSIVYHHNNSINDPKKFDLINKHHLIYLQKHYRLNLYIYFIIIYQYARLINYFRQFKF